MNYSGSLIEAAEKAMESHRNGSVDVSEFIRGQRACRNGDDCPIGSSDDFIRGYGCEYQLGVIREENGFGG